MPATPTDSGCCDADPQVITAVKSSNDWRMVRMYELMEDFEEVLSRAPVSVCAGAGVGEELPILWMGGGKKQTNRNNCSSNNAAADAGEVATTLRGMKSSQMAIGRGGGGENSGKVVVAGEEEEKDGGAQRDDPAVFFTAGNCLSSGCCYTSSSTESDTVQTPRRPDLSKSASKYKKQRERLLSRPTL